MMPATHGPLLVNLAIFGGVGVAAWFLVIYFWPRIILSIFKRAILVTGGAQSC